MKHLRLICLSIMLFSLLMACGSEQSKTDDSVKETEMITHITSESENIEQEEVNVRTKKKPLIAYFSLVDIVPDGADASTHATPVIGNTESAAYEIQKQTEGDLFAIKTKQMYPVSHRECSAIAEDEMKSDARPELSSHVENMEDYDTIYIGYPIWWYQEPMAIRTFLEEYDFSGKTIIPFCTTLGAGIDESVENIKNLCPDATVLEGITLHTERESFRDSITEWLDKIGINDNE